jgi:hypothetical protein
MKVNNIIDVAEDEVPIKNYKIDQRSVIHSSDNIPAFSSPYLNINGKTVKTLDGSISADIVINSEDKEYVNPDNKLLDEEREAKREMLFRQARLLYPEKEEWVLSMAIDAYIEQEEKGIDITTYKFGSSEPPTPEEKFDKKLEVSE